MSTGLIVLIIIAAVIIAAVVLLTPRARARTQERARMRALENRRHEVAGAHRAAADSHLEDAERLAEEARARRAEADAAERRADASRAEAAQHASHATLHERGLADDRLVDGEGRLRDDAGDEVPRAERFTREDRERDALRGPERADRR